MSDLLYGIIGGSAVVAAVSYALRTIYLIHPTWPYGSPQDDQDTETTD